MNRQLNLKLLVPCIVAGALACDDSPTNSRGNSGVFVDFRVENASGLRTTTFRYGEDIHFSYTARNLTGSDLTWYSGCESPVSFEVGIAGSGSGPAFFHGFGSTCLPARTSGGFWIGQRIAVRTTWQSNPWMAWLPPGEYKVVTQGLSFSLIDRGEPQSSPIRILPKNDGDVHLFTLVHEPFGPHLAPGEVYWASLFRLRDGRVEMTASVVTPSDDSELCSQWYVNERCLRQQVLAPRILNAAEATTLDRLLRDFPSATPEIDGACDPFGLLRYHFQDRIAYVNGCATGPPEYLAGAWDLAEFVGEAVGD